MLYLCRACLPFITQFNIQKFYSNKMMLLHEKWLSDHLNLKN
ncbi:hypothetical protein [Moraxella lacunata]